MIVLSSGLLLLTALDLRARLRGRALDFLFAVAGVGLGTGALLVQRGVRPIEWFVTATVLGALVPFHARLLFGGKGPSRV